MTTRAALDKAFAASPVVGSEPREGIFRYVHPHRLRISGLKMEARVWLKARRRDDRPKPFLIYGRPRSGTTLLVKLMDQVPGLRCDGELLHDFILRPEGFLRDLPKRAGPDIKAYGVKLLSYQLMEVQRVHRPLAFFDALLAMDYALVHLTRDSWGQTLSLVKAQTSGLYFGETAGREELTLNPEAFLASLRWNEAMLAYERAVMAHLPHLALHYDNDLKDAAQHQQVVDRLCSALGLPTAQVTATLERTGGKSGPQKVVNMDAVKAHVAEAGLGHLIPG